MPQKLHSDFTWHLYRNIQQIQYERLLTWQNLEQIFHNLENIKKSNFPKLYI